MQPCYAVQRCFNVSSAAEGITVGSRGSSDQSDLLSRCHIAAAELGLPTDAVVLVRLALENLTQAFGPGATSDRVSAAALCDSLLRCDTSSERAAAQLCRVGLATSEQVGRVVEWLVVDGVINPRTGESSADYCGLFDVRAVPDAESAEPEQNLQPLLDLSERQGYVTWQQITEVVPLSRSDTNAAFAILNALERRGVVLIDDSDEAVERDRAFDARLADEQGRRPCWQLGDGWNFTVEADPFPCRSSVPTTFRLRCGYVPDRPPDPEAVAFRVWAGSAEFAAADPPEEFWRGPWVPVAERLVGLGEFRLSLPAGVVFIQFQIEQPDYRPEPWEVSPWRLVVAIDAGAT